jgi:uncharacterized phage-associated protein
MKPPVCDTPFDVAAWLMDRAMQDGEYLQPQKLHRIMYLAQAYYAAASKGQRLMPAIFVTSTFGPIEPCTFRAFENGRPELQIRPIPVTQKHFLDSVWRRFGAHTVDYLNRMIGEHSPYLEAQMHGLRGEISLDSMVEFYGRQRPSTEASQGSGATRAPPTVEQVMRPRVMRSHKGKPVNVHPWMPKKRVPDDK